MIASHVDHMIASNISRGKMGIRIAKACGKGMVSGLMSMKVSAMVYVHDWQVLVWPRLGAGDELGFLSCICLNLCRAVLSHRPATFCLLACYLLSQILPNMGMHVACQHYSSAQPALMQAAKCATSTQPPCRQGPWSALIGWSSMIWRLLQVARLWA